MSTSRAIFPSWIKIHFYDKVRVILGFEILMGLDIFAFTTPHI